MERRHFLLAGSSLLSLYLAGCGGGDDAPQTQPTPDLGPSPVLQRRNVTSLSTLERQQFINTLMTMKKSASSYDSSTNAYDYFVNIHVEAFSDHKNAHMSASFLPWHREMLMRFEKEMRKASGDNSMTLPYWDWHQPQSHTKIFTDDFLGGNGDPLDKRLVKNGAFRVGQWNMAKTFDETPDEFADTDADGTDDADTSALSPLGLTRNYSFQGVAQSDLTFLDDYMSDNPLQALLDIPDYDTAPYMDSMMSATARVQNFAAWNTTSMRKHLERILHNTVHACMGGQMGTGSSPNDPAFFLHHCNVDRLWALWQEKFANAGYPTSEQSSMTGAESALDIYAEKIVIKDTFDLQKHSGVTYKATAAS